MRSCFEFIKRKTRHELIGAEIGVRRGINAEDVLKNLNIKKLYLIDSWQGREGEGFKVAHDKFSGDKRVCILNVTSVMAASLITEPLDFVYIDADHSYENVLQDLCIWTKKVKLGGFVCGHDYVKEWHGVREAVWDYCTQRSICYSVQAEGKGLKLEHEGKLIFSCDWWFQKGEEIESK